MISSQSPEHCQLFLTNWLAIHPIWFSWLNHNPLHNFQSPQQWRKILHSVPSKAVLEVALESSMGNKTAKGQKLAALEILGNTASMMTVGSTLAPSNTVVWCGKYIPITSLTNPPLPHQSNSVGGPQGWLALRAVHPQLRPSSTNMGRISYRVSLHLAQCSSIIFQHFNFSQTICATADL